MVYPQGMPYTLASFIAVTIFACIHLFAHKLRQLTSVSNSRFLSTGSGVAIAYVFLDILPKLSENDAIVRSATWKVFPYVEKHVYIMALCGFLLFFLVDRSEKLVKQKSTFFYLSLASYALFNFFIGYAIVDKENPEVQPLILFTFAIALHYFMNDYSLGSIHGKLYSKTGKWILVFALFAGWVVGLATQLSPAAIGLVSAFIGGGVIMNVTRHELPEENPHSVGAFLLATAAYTLILLSLGSKG
jgi:hypothetical protein